tara:strand:+ start:724 stop:978 length:255 start_codon:yes stop_codon:yes gene_type:complete
MGKNCIYCKKDLAESEVLDVCAACGFQVWGKTMYEAIKENMKQADQDGDLYQGSVSNLEETPEQSTETNPNISIESPDDPFSNI